MLPCFEWARLKGLFNQPFSCEPADWMLTVCLTNHCACFCFQWVEYRKLDHAHGVRWSRVLCGVAASILGPADQRGRAQDGCGTRLIHHHHQVGRMPTQLFSPWLGSFSALFVSELDWFLLKYTSSWNFRHSTTKGGFQFQNWLDVRRRTRPACQFLPQGVALDTCPWPCIRVLQCVRLDSITCMRSLLRRVLRDGYPGAPAN